MTLKEARESVLREDLDKLLWSSTVEQKQSFEQAVLKTIANDALERYWRDGEGASLTSAVGTEEYHIAVWNYLIQRVPSLMGNRNPPKDLKEYLSKS